MREIVEQFLVDREIEFVAAADVADAAGNAWSFTVPGSAKHAIGVAFAATGSGLRVESFFLRAPQENHADVYRLLLSRNTRGRMIWCAADALGDLYLLGFLPLDAVSDRSLDEMLGELVTASDELFTATIERGFATYLASDMAWRDKQIPDE